MTGIRLGALTLDRVVGRGGMGTVWSARHADGTEVAVKVVRGEEAGVLAEVAAVAPLRHPGIVQVYDYGRAPPHVDLGGSAWLAMEWLPGGSLERVGPTLAWPAIRSVLATLLRALAHAHARGVVHRDLKPANVLRDAYGAWRLADFGLARPIGEGRSEGTIDYMAPEQLRGRGWANGPATDLWALGVTAWELCTGTMPFDGAVAARIVDMEAGRLPPFVPRTPVPPEVEGWIVRLLEPDPEVRPDRAGAEHALLPDGPTGEGVPAPIVPRRRSSDTFRLDALDGPVAAAPADPEGRRDAVRHVAVPEVWPAPSERPPPPSSLGLTLVGLCEPVPVGRGAELAALWSELREAVRTRRPRVVAITGEAGIGRRTVALAVARALAESGAGRGLRVRASSLPVDLARAAWALPADPAAALARLLPRLPRATEPVADAFREVLAGQPVTAAVAATLATDLLVAVAREGPVVVVVEGDGEAARSFALRVRDEEGPALVLAVREEAGADREIALAWLAPGDRAQLLDRLVPHAPGAADALAARVGGSPAALVGAIRRLAAADELVAGADGFSLGPGADALLAGAPRPEPWLASLEPEARGALEVAGWLGAWVSDATWRIACAAAGCAIPVDLVERGVRAGWLARARDGFAFGAPEVRAALGPIRADDPRPVAVAAALADDATAAVAGELLLAAGRPAEARALLERGAANARAWLGDREAERLYALVERACEEDGDPERAAFFATWRAWVLAESGRADEAEEIGAALVARSRERGWPAVEGSALHALALVSQRRGEEGRVPELIRAAIVGYRAGGEETFAVQLEVQQLDGEAGLAELRRRFYAATDPDRIRVVIAMRWTTVASLLGRADEMREALAVCEGLAGRRTWIFYRLLLDAPLAAGDPDLAERLARAVIGTAVDARSPSVVHAGLVLAAARVLRGEPADDDVFALLRRVDADANLLALGWLLLAASAALRSDRAAYDERVAEAIPPPTTWRRERCLAAARILELTRDAWTRAGDVDRARGAAQEADRIRARR